MIPFYRQRATDGGTDNLWGDRTGRDVKEVEDSISLDVSQKSTKQKVATESRRMEGLEWDKGK